MRGRAIQIEVLDRLLNCQLEKNYWNTSLSLITELTDTMEIRNMTGASIWGILEDEEGNKTTVIFTENQPELYEVMLNLSDYAPGSPFNLTIHVTLAGYVSKTVQTELISPFHDISADNIAIYKNVTNEGNIVDINVTLINLGTYSEICNITLYYNSSEISTQNATLSLGNSTVVIFNWNTTGNSFGNYSISALVWSVIDEEHINNNNLTQGWVFITIPGDVNGDRKVDIFDIVLMGSIYGCIKPDACYDPNCDLNDDGKINIFDIVEACTHYKQKW